MGTDGLTKYYNFANATWGTASAKFSLQPNVTYVINFETDGTGRFRYRICNQAGSALVNGTTVWIPFSTVLNDPSNTYWPFLGDADPSASGALDVYDLLAPVRAGAVGAHRA